MFPAALFQAAVVHCSYAALWPCLPTRLFLAEKNPWLGHTLVLNLPLHQDK